MAISHSMTHSRAYERAKSLLREMSVQQKVGQLVQVQGDYGQISDDLRYQVTEAGIGSVINEVAPDTIAELQRLAREETAHGIPLLMGRDVIHGFKTVFPIPLGMASTWDAGLIEAAARMSAHEAAQQGINWTFSPMVDVSRDPRWGRIAESFGEDPLLASDFGAAMVRGYQNGTSAHLIACLKHFVGYGACEAGKDYNTTNIPEVELRNVHLRPFRAAVQTGAMTLMPSFSDLNGRPPTGNAWLLRDVLRQEWGFAGFVVSDWASVIQLVVHGVAEDDKTAVSQAVAAGVNMDMASGAYAKHLADLIAQGDVDEALVDQLVLEVLATKFHAGLFDRPARPLHLSVPNQAAEILARRVAQESMVLLKNEGELLPLVRDQRKIALFGPMADEAHEQLGTWVFDGDVESSISLRDALAQELGDGLAFERVLATTRDHREERFDLAVEMLASCDMAILALGEEAILSGEAHCRADIGLPGAQMNLVARLATLGKPLVVIVMAGRPLVMPELVEQADALLYAWHPGSQAGPALVNVLFGEVSPSARLPVTLPRSVGQIPIYYGHGHTGKPATPDTVIHMNDIETRAAQTSVGNTSFHLDVDPSPLFPFGFGLTYTKFEYANLRCLDQTGDARRIAVEVTNVGARTGVETVQWYVRDQVASITRPVRELKGYEKITLLAGETKQVSFLLRSDDLIFHNGLEDVFEPGRFSVWVGSDATAQLGIEVEMQST